jgi:hypothetical protein
MRQPSDRGDPRRTHVNFPPTCRRATRRDRENRRHAQTDYPRAQLSRAFHPDPLAHTLRSYQPRDRRRRADTGRLPSCPTPVEQLPHGLRLLEGDGILLALALAWGLRREFPPLQPKDLVLPLPSDETRHIDGSIVRPQDPQDRRPSLANVEPIWQCLPGTLSFDGMPIAGRRRLLSTKFIEWCPEAKYPAPYPQLGQPHHVTLNLHCSVPP